MKSAVLLVGLFAEGETAVEEPVLTARSYRACASRVSRAGAARRNTDARLRAAADLWRSG